MLEGKGDTETFSQHSLVNLELKEWRQLNASLKQHGLKGISLLSPSSFKKPEDHWMLLDAENSASIRSVIGVLMRDADRRQELVQDMISTNAQLREELSALARSNKNLQSKLDVLTARNDEALESKKKKDASKKMKEANDALERVKEELKEKEEQVDALTRKLTCFVQEEEARRRRGEQAVQKLLKKPAKERIDDNIVSLIDMYERELVDVRKDVQAFPMPYSTPQPTIHFKSLIKSLERKVADGVKRNKELLQKCQQLQNDLQSKEAQLKNRKVEKVYIRQSKDSQRSLSPASSSAAAAPSFLPARPPSSSTTTLSLQARSTRLVHLRSLPAPQCHHYLDSTCSLLGVCDLEDIGPAIDKLSRHSSTFSQLEMFIRDMHVIITRYNLPRPPNKNCPCSQGHTCSDKHCMLETLDFWVKQMRHLKELQHSLTNLSEKLFPWRPIKLDPKTCSTLDLVDMVDGMVEEGTGAIKHSDADTSDKEQLVKIVRHFQQLFNVSQMTGVYARMSHVYRRLNEDRNFITNVKAALKLEKSTSPMDVMGAVSRLKLTGSPLNPPLNPLLDTVDQADSTEIERLRSNLKTHEAFCTAFHRTMQQLMFLLGVESPGHVLPSVKILCDKLNHMTSYSQTLKSSQHFSTNNNAISDLDSHSIHKSPTHQQQPSSSAPPPPSNPLLPPSSHHHHHHKSPPSTKTSSSSYSSSRQSGPCAADYDYPGGGDNDDGKSQRNDYVDEEVLSDCE